MNGGAVVKLLLCMIVIGASLAVGLTLSSRLSERTKTLSAYITLLEEVAVRMRYYATDLAALFSDNFAGFQFLSDRPFDVQFARMVRERQHVLNAEDLKLLDEFGRDLGTSDIDSQQRHIRLYIKLLTEQLDQAREDEQRKGRLYRLLPLSIGIAAAILLI